MKHVLVIILIILNINFMWAMTINIDSLNCDSIYSSIDSLVIPPKYENSIDSFIRLNERLAIPPPVISGTIPSKARVFIEFNVDKEGRVFAPSVVKIVRMFYNMEYDESYQKYDKNWSLGIDFNFCEQEAFRILNSIKFISAQKGNVNVCFEKMRTIIIVYYAGPGYD